MDKKKRTEFSEVAVAYHEAGHAVMHIIQRSAFRYATIAPDVDEGSLGHVLGKTLRNFRPDLDDGPRTVALMERMIFVALAGDAAERKKFASHKISVKTSDWDGAMDLAFRMHGDGKITGLYVDYMWARTAALIGSPLHWPGVVGVAEALLVHRKLSASRIRKIYRAMLEADFQRQIAERKRRRDSE